MRVIREVWAKYKIEIDTHTADGLRVAENNSNWPLMIGSGAVALAGVGLAYLMYVARPSLAVAASRSCATPYYLSLNRLYVDEIYGAIFVGPMKMLAVVCKAFESVVYDLVRLIASIPTYAANAIRPLQNGLVQFYALSTIMGVAAFLGYLVLFAK